MNRRSSFSIAVSCGALLLLSQVSWAQKKPLTHDVYDSWKSIAGISLSSNGKWVGYAINPQVGDGELFVKETHGSQLVKVERGSGLRFTHEGTWAMCTVAPPKAEVDKAKREKKAPKDQPKNNVHLIELSSGKSTVLERVKATRVPTKFVGWFAYQNEEPPTPPKPAEPAKPAEPTKPPLDFASGSDFGQALVEDQRGQGGGQRGQTGTGTPAPAVPAADPQSGKKKEHTVGQEWILRSVSSGNEIKLADVSDLQFTPEGNAVIYSVSSKSGRDDGLFWLDLTSGKTTEIMKGMAQFRQISLHKESGSVIFLSDSANYKTEPSVWDAYVWKPGSSAKVVLAYNHPSIPKEWALLPRGEFNLSQDGKRLFVSLGTKPEPEPKEAPPADEEKAVLDIWSHTDKMLMSQQLLQVAQLRNQSFSAVVNLADGKLVPLEDSVVSSVTVGNRGNARYALGVDSDTYARAGSWGEDFNEIYIVDTESGVRRKVLSNMATNPSLTVSGNFAVWYDAAKDDYMSLELSTNRIRNFTEAIPYPLYDVDDDHPGPRPAAGFPQMLSDGRVLITDGFDLYACDPAGTSKIENVTEGVGRIRSWRFAVTPMPRDPDSPPGLPVNEDLLLSVTDTEDYDTGFFSDRIGNGRAPVQLLFGAKSFQFAGKALNSNEVVIRQGDFDEYPNLWLTDTSMKSPQIFTDANPQQKDYIWGKSELVHWTSSDGVPLKGVLIKPENFDPAKKYPMMVYFYEISSNDVHQHFVPAPSASTINPTMFASNGYVVFMPDIVYNVGYPGEGAEKCILPGVTAVLSRGYVDPKRMAIQGQSWGGYQVMHLITRTKMFAAAGAGAAVSNMFSAYGGIREGSGLVRQFQYEYGQSRIGGSIWENPLRYIENSPLFWADKVETPVLMMNNDKDDAVPYSQGVEMFTALRRLDKKAWMLNYNGDRHNLMQRANRKDLSVRLHQFFDHYLKGAPMPKWMAEGVPATQKGKSYGFEPAKP